MASIGSVFLGDLQRVRNLSTSPASTPPSSPSPSSMPTVFGSTIPIHAMLDDHHANTNEQNLKLSSSSHPTFDGMSENQNRPPTIDPVQALELRLRWLEAIVIGLKQDGLGRDNKGKAKEKEWQGGETLTIMAENVQHKLDSVVEGNESLKRFMNNYDQNAQYLTLSFALSGILPEPPAYENISLEEMEALLTEMEPDIRVADRDMREIDNLEKKGVTEAGKLGDYEVLRPRLDALINAHKENLTLAASLEKRVASLMERHATHVDALSELFIAWDDTLTEADDKVAKLARDRSERQRLGLE